MQRIAFVFVVVFLWSVAGASTVAAAPPSNDDISTPVIVTGIPYSDGPYDTTEATTGASDPGFCSFPEAGADRATVWYAFTPAESGAYRSDTFGSDYDTTLYVGVADGAGGIDVIACNDDAGGLQSAVIWEASPDTTYLIAVGTCCGGGTAGEPGGGGMLELHVLAAPPPPTIDVIVDATGGFTKDGAAIISGTLECSPGISYVSVFTEVTQTVGRFTVTGFGGAWVVDCASSWTAVVESSDGLFRGGKAEVSASAFGCDLSECVGDSTSRTVRLGKIERPAVSPPMKPPAVSPPMKPPAVCPPKGGADGSPPHGPPACPGPVSPPVSPPVSWAVGVPGSGDASHPILAALRVDPVHLAGIAFILVLSSAVVAGAMSAAQPWWLSRFAERPSS